MRTKHSAYERWAPRSQLERITNWAANGCTMEELARNMGVSPSTLYKMRSEHKDVEKAIEDGRMLGVQAVENSLFRLATGQAWEESEVTEKESDAAGRERVHVRRIRTRKAPNATAAIFYLKNRAGYRDNPAPRPEDVAAGTPDDPLSAALDEVARGLEDGRHGA